MTDTDPRAAELQRALLMARSGAERLEMAGSMFDTARALMRAALDGERTLGGRSSPKLRVRVFERTYGRDFDAATTARIVAHLRRGG